MNTRPALLALLTAPLALSLVACGGDSDDDDAASTASTSESPAATSSSSAPDPSANPSTSADPSAPSDSSSASSSAGAAGDDALLAAARTGRGAVDGTVFTVDRDNGGWEVTVVAADGTESDLTTSADGASVTRGPVVDRDDADDTSDVTERRRLLGDATVTYEDALATARGEVPGVAVDGIDLDLDAGRAVWDVQLGEDTADEQTVVVDAATGDVVRVERDD